MKSEPNTRAIKHLVAFPAAHIDAGKASVKKLLCVFCVGITFVWGERNWEGSTSDSSLHEENTGAKEVGEGDTSEEGGSGEREDLGDSISVGLRGDDKGKGERDVLLDDGVHSWGHSETCGAVNESDAAERCLT